MRALHDPTPPAAATHRRRRAAAGGSCRPRWWRLPATLLLGAALAGCSLLGVKQEYTALYASTVLVGRVDCPPAWQGPVVVAALAADEGRARVVHQTLLHECGGYELIVPQGRYTVFGFGDANRNFVWDAGEPAGEYAAAAPVLASGDGVVAALDFALAPQAAWRAGVEAGQSFDDPDAPRHSVQAGALADLDAAAFSAASGSRGYWAPVESFRQGMGNIVFLEPYDPAKTPILFVHGAAGSPQDWRHFVQHLDRARYQPWLFQYPSGAALESMAYLLYWKLLNLQLRYRFDRLVLVAHSMGGLVARSFLLDFGSQFPQIRRFVTLSTPWGGEAAAELGVKHSPAVVPSWIDMQPEGRFLQRLFARPLPAHVTHHLFFGHKGGYSLLRPNNDGTVTLASQLRPEAQAGARMVVGFDEDHDGILRSPQVLRQFQAVVDGASPAPGQAAAAGEVELHFEFAAGSDAAAAGLPTLWLLPLDTDAAAGAAAQPGIAFTLRAEDSGRRIGPIPPGVYEVGLLAAGFRTEPRRQTVLVQAANVAALGFRLVPQGTLSGYVATRRDGPAAAAGSFLPPDAEAKIRRISLAGAEQMRSLVPRQSGPADLLGSYLDGRDDAYQAHFSFVGLPAGEYELLIEAEGHRPHRSRHAVLPGRQGPLRPIVLEPLR